MNRALALIATLAVGALVAFQPPANAMLARHVSDLGAALVSLLISTTIVVVLLVAVGDPGQLRGLADFRPAFVLGGIAGAAIVVVSLITVRSLGAGGVVAALVSTQLIAAAVIDRVGALGVAKVALTPARIGGIALLIAGTVMVTSR